ncbi:hypothetical protein MJH12_09850, partial [bacterium]|nr:hypothetical protein [bacterium]
MNFFAYFFYAILIIVSSVQLSAMECINGGDSQAHFQYSGVLTDNQGQNISGFQVIQMRFDLFSAIDGVQSDYSQVFAAVDVQDGIFHLEVGPCLPDLSTSHYVQLSVNQEELSSRTKLVSLPLSIQAVNSQKLSGLTTQELFLKIDTAINLVLADFSTNNLNPSLNTLTQNLQNHESSTNNPHSVNKDQVGLSLVDNIQQLPLTALEIVLNPSSDLNIPSSKAVADHVQSQLSTFNVTGFEIANPNLISHLSRFDNPHTITKSQLNLDLVSNVLQLPMSYLQTILSTTSDINVPSSSAVATYVEKRFSEQAVNASDAFNTSEVTNLKSSILANGTSPWLVSKTADAFTTSDVSNL